MDKYQFEAYWQARLAFLGAGNVRIHTERGGDLGFSIKVYLSQVVMPRGIFGGKRYTLSYIIEPIYLRSNDYQFACREMAREARRRWDLMVRPNHDTYV